MFFWDTTASPSQSCKTLTHISGLISGTQTTYTWGEQRRSYQFFDIKGDVHAVLAALGVSAFITYESIIDHPALHPGKQAALVMQGCDQPLGYLGQLHPNVHQQFELKSPVFLFEIVLNYCLPKREKTYEALSKFPTMSRDLCLHVPKHGVTVSAVEARIVLIAGKSLKEIELFDMYFGENIDTDYFSMTWRLVFQHPARTLTDVEINPVLDAIIDDLKNKFNVRLRA